MATRITRTVVDDIDGSDTTVGTHRFALEDVTFEIDLSEANLARLRDALAPFMTAGRRLPKNTNGRSTTRTSAPSDAVKQTRRWWAHNQHRDDLPEYRASGRIPQQVTDAYQQAGAPRQH